MKTQKTMKTTSKFLLKGIPVILMMTLIGATLSCSGDDDGGIPDETSNCEQLLDEYQVELAAAVSTFNQNPTEANCEAYRGVVLDYFDDLEDCAFTDAQFDAIEEAAQEVLDLDCTQFE